ncbi:MAG: hypothetical protein HS113_29770 [Verrucomicrobiales bacterium]|nr:hypothetical protein [Verrucomicrobiales bacterium]
MKQPQTMANRSAKRPPYFTAENCGKFTPKTQHYTHHSHNETSQQHSASHETATSKVNSRNLQKRQKKTLKNLHKKHTINKPPPKFQTKRNGPPKICKTPPLQNESNASKKSTATSKLQKKQPTTPATGQRVLAKTKKQPPTTATVQNAITNQRPRVQQRTRKIPIPALQQG